jgi:glycosyltransferase involved in cell wall biosynthesis
MMVVMGVVTEPEHAQHRSPAPGLGAPALPRISIVTPSYNQGRFLGETMASVLDQGYPDLEYVVVDGGSTDDSASVIRSRERELAWWASEKDGGQYGAINKGFARTTGDVMAWLNSDDKYTPWALRVVGEVFAQLPEVQWVTTLLPLHWDARGVPTKCKPVRGYSKSGFFRGHHLVRPGEWDKAFIQQESTFWRRSLWEKVGGRVDASLQLAGDFELWAKFYQHADLYGIPLPLGGFRVHGDQKTAQRMEAYVREAEAVLARHGGRAEPLPKPSPLARLWGKAVGADEQHKVCVNRGGRWVVASRW